MRRRDFLAHLGAGSALAFLPAFTRDAFAANATDDALIISEVEILKLSGTHELVPGLNRQYQVNPLHVYAERRPKPFKDPAPGTKAEKRPLTHYYVRIRTKGGVEGLYGAVDREALPVLLGTLRPLVIGQNALAVERIWDQMYRSNRHSRASHFMMAISYIDNALWDLRGRQFGAPVFRLLGGPTQQPVRVYGSCLGFCHRSAAGRRNAPRSSQKDGFIHQKWFLGYGPGDGARGMDLNVQLVKALREAVGDDVQTHVRRLPGLGPAVRARVVPQGRAVPAVLRRRSRAHVRPREFHPPVASDHGAHRHGRTSVRPLGGRAILQGRRAAVHPGGSRVVRRRQRDREGGAPRLRARRQTTAALSQRARRPAHRRQPVAVGVPVRRVPHQPRAREAALHQGPAADHAMAWCSCPRSPASASSSIRPRSRSRKS